MQIFLNGAETEIAEDLTTQRLIEELGLQDRRIAVEINQELVIRSAFATHRIQPGDRVEIIQAIGGG